MIFVLFSIIAFLCFNSNVLLVCFVIFWYYIFWFTVDCLSGLYVFYTVFYDLHLIVFLDCEFLHCILWFTVVFRTVSFCPGPSYFYFSIVFLVIHVIKAINRGLGELLRLLFIFQVFYWQKLKNIRLKIPQGNKI